MSRLTRDGTAEPVSRDQILRHARGQGNIIFSVQLTTSRIGNLTRLIHTLLYVMTIHTYIHTIPLVFGSAKMVDNTAHAQLTPTAVHRLFGSVMLESTAPEGEIAYRRHLTPYTTSSGQIYVFPAIVAMPTKQHVDHRNLLIYTTSTGP